MIVAFLLGLLLGALLVLGQVLWCLNAGYLKINDVSDGDR